MPDAPGDVTAVPGNRSAAIRWLAPRANGAAIIHYVVTPYVASVAQTALSKMVPAPVTSTGIAGVLTNGTSYTFRVAAINSVGSGPAASSPPIRVGTPAAPLVSALGSSTRAAVSWPAPVNSAATITAYVVRVYQGTTLLASKSHTVTCVQPCTPARSWTVTGLTNSVSYSFAVAAVNARGTGPQGTTTVIVAACGVKPGAPSGVYAFADIRRATVRWTAPTAGSATIDGYVVTPYRAGVAQSAITFNSRATAQLVGGLTAGISYTFEVAARNAVGTGPRSNPGNAVMPAAPPPPPSSIAALGDSLTAAFNSCGTFGDCPANSWSTGTAINSHYRRIRVGHPAINGHVFNDAQSGYPMSALAGQASTAVSQGVQYVTILMGTNDACRGTEAAMTAVSAFETQFRQAMVTIRSGLPNARVFVTSLLDVHRVWSLGRNNPEAAAAWAAFPICDTMLRNPTSTAPADVDRRNRVRQRIIDYNAVLKSVCAQFANCRFDGHAVFTHRWTTAEISTEDYIHPSVAGQEALASATYAAGYNW